MSASTSTTGGTVNSGSATSKTAISFGRSVRGIRLDALIETIVVDEYGRDYAISADAFLGAPTPEFDSAAALTGFGEQLQTFSADTYTLAFGETLDSRDLLPGAQLNGARLFMEMNGNEFGAASAFNLSPALLFGAGPRDLLFNADLVDPDAAGNAYMGFVKNPVSFAVKGQLGSGFYAKGGTFFGDIENDPAAELTTSDDPNLANRATGLWGSVVETGFQLSKGSTLSFAGGTVMEKGTVLGMASSGATKLADQATTGFISASATFDLGKGFKAFGGYDMGWTKADAAANSLITDVSTLESSAFRIGFSKTGVIGSKDRFGFILSQPLQVNSGSVGLNLPTSREMDGSVNYTSTRGSMASTARALDWQAFYATEINDNSSLSTGLLLRQNDGAGGADNEAVLLSRYRLNF